MTNLTPRQRRRLAGAVLLASLMLAWSPRAFALNPALDVSQYAHTSWKIREGFTKGVIVSMAQTPDGYLWLGTEYGLVRFDGVRAVPWQPPSNQHLPSSEIDRLLAARDGTLWIGTSKGLASWRDGRVTEYPEIGEHKVVTLLEDRDGTVWVGALSFFSPANLCSIRNGRVECFGQDGRLGVGVLSLYEDTKGTLWAGVQDGVWRWKPGSPRFYSVPDQDPNFGIGALVEGDDGAPLIATDTGIRRLVDGKFEPYPLPGPARRFNARFLLRDRDGGLWIGTVGEGLIHVHDGRADVFAQSDGLSSQGVEDLFEDREGNIWVGTLDGLDRFRELAVPTFSVKQGLSNPLTWAVVAARDGSVWVATAGDLNRWQNAQITTFGRRDEKLTGVAARSLFQDARGRIWVATPREFGYLERDRLVPVKGAPGGATDAIAEDIAGNLWIANRDAGLFRLFRGNVVQQISWAKLGRKQSAGALAADPVRGGVWIGFFEGGIVHFRDGEIRAAYSPTDGLGEGHVSGIRLDGDGTLWAATEGGLSRVKDGRVTTLRTSNGLPCDSVYWMMQDDAHARWLYTTCGLFRIARSEFDAWLTDPKRTVHVTAFDYSDGVRISATHFGFGPPVAKTPDGQLWFRSLDGVSVIDPQHLAVDKTPPPVHIEQIIADRTTYDAPRDASAPLDLPALVRDVQIDYTALSLAAPEKVRFRYKLDGSDRDWVDVGDRRKAFYNNLPPRSYRFRVMAANASGVWSTEVAVLDFDVAPTWYQRRSFIAAMVGLAALLIGLSYHLRVRQVSRALSQRFDERLAERTRVARELHDTFLQTVNGSRVVADHALTNRADHEGVVHAMEQVSQWLRQATDEARAALNSLRASTTETNDLAEALRRTVDECRSTTRADVSFAVHGDAQEMHPVVREEVYRIGYEAIRNACVHANADRVVVSLEYGHDLTLRVSDNGVGIDPVILETGKEGHFGLRGMKERAERIDARLSIASSPQVRTAITLVVPGRTAFRRFHVTKSAAPVRRLDES